MADYSSFELQGKVAVVTGGTKGIGGAIATAYAQAGCNVAVASRTVKDCEAKQAELEKIGIKALGVPADITKIDEIKKLNKAVLDKFGKIDVLVNNAGTAVTKLSEELTEADWDYVVDLNLKAQFFCSQILSESMRERKTGSIIMINSGFGIRPEKRVLPYCASKGGLVQVARVLAIEWYAKYQIRVNSLVPGYFKTDINEEVMSNQKIYDTIRKRSPMNRFGELPELVGAALFMASDKLASYMTGQMLIVDGGTYPY